MTGHHDIIAAFVDNEPVGAEDLSAALAAPEGRDYLIDLLVLRGFVGDADAQAAGEPFGRTTRGRALWLTAAAALLAVGVAAGFFAGRLTPGGSRAIDVRAATEMSAPVGGTTTAPAPTHVIRMERGVDWNERSGGN